MKIVSSSPDRQRIMVFSGDRHLSGGSAAGGVVYLDKWGRMPDSVMLIEPVGYPDMQRRMGGAERMLSDYWGVQEEACVHGVPCVALGEEMGRSRSRWRGCGVMAWKSF